DGPPNGEIRWSNRRWRSLQDVARRALEGETFGSGIHSSRAVRRMVPLESAAELKAEPSGDIDDALDDEQLLAALRCQLRDDEYALLCARLDHPGVPLARLAIRLGQNPAAVTATWKRVMRTVRRLRHMS